MLIKKQLEDKLQHIERQSARRHKLIMTRTTVIGTATASVRSSYILFTLSVTDIDRAHPVWEQTSRSVEALLTDEILAIVVLLMRAAPMRRYGS